MRRSWSFRLGWPVALAAVFGPAAWLAAQPANPPGVYNAPPRIHREDKPNIWTLGLRFKDVRTVQVEVPGRGRKTVYYMWYQVYNTTPEPRSFDPQFDLVTHDRNTVHPDEALPTVQEAIRRIESPYLKPEQFKNYVTIAEQPIPVTPELSDLRTVTGVALWSDVQDRAPGTTSFSVLVSGLSDGYTREGDGDAAVIRRKTLQLNFRRYSDGRRQDTQDIKYVPPESWNYISSSFNILGK